jgi:hypothetical protein
MVRIRRARLLPIDHLRTVLTTSVEAIPSAKLTLGNLPLSAE